MSDDLGPGTLLEAIEDIDTHIGAALVRGAIYTCLEVITQDRIIVEPCTAHGPSCPMVAGVLVREVQIPRSVHLDSDQDYCWCIHSFRPVRRGSESVVRDLLVSVPDRILEDA